MDDALDTFLERLRERRGTTCSLTHGIGGTRDLGGLTVIWGNAEGLATLEASATAPDVVGVTIRGARLPEEWYTEVTAELVKCGVQRIDLQGWGWWIGPGSPPKAAWIVDHIACHTASALTGSASAKRGQAFVSMRDAYERAGEMRSRATLRRTELTDAVLWHTLETEHLSDDEIQMARSAGCSVAGPNVAPWAIGARAAGIKFAARLASPIGLGRAV